MTLILKHVDELRRSSINVTEKLRDVVCSDLLLSLIRVCVTQMQVVNFQRMSLSSHSPRVVGGITIQNLPILWTAVMP